MESRKYPTDLSDDEWRCITVRIFPSPQGGDVLGCCTAYGRSSSTLSSYVLKSGCPWRLVPRDYVPPWKSASTRLVQEEEEEEEAHQRDVVGASEHRTARAPAFAAWQEPEPQPAPGSWTPNCAKTSGVGAEQRGYDAVARRSAGARGSCWWILKA